MKGQDKVVEIEILQFGFIVIIGVQPPNGIDIGLCIGALVSFVLALIASLLIGDKKDKNVIQLMAEK